MNQKGIAPFFILIALAVIFVVAALAFGYFNSNKDKAIEEEVSISQVSSGRANPLQGSSQSNPQNCSDTDYTGCDTASDFMTWQDDGIRNPEDDSSINRIFEK